MFSEVSHWQNSEWVDSTSIVILSHVDKQTFFVGELFVVVHSSIDFDWLVYVHLTVFPEVINVLITLPRRPNEICINEIFALSRMPPVTMFDDRLNYLVVVSVPYRKLLVELEKLFFFFELFSLFY